MFVSLSGGYDSRGIVAILRDIITPKQHVICFSHNFGNDTKGTDADIASQIAHHLDFEFKLINSYNDDPYKVIKTNAELGQGLAYFCVETDAWEIINKEFQTKEDSILLVGDMNDGAPTGFHGNAKRAIEVTSIYDSIILKENKKLFSETTLKRLVSEWQVEYNKILDKTNCQKNIIDVLDYLYLDQRISHVNSVARECFQMPFIETTAPYHDNNVIDFISKLPYNLRDSKKLHCYTFEMFYSELFNIEFPNTGWGKEPDWMFEIEKFSDKFIADIKYSNSRLDEIINPDILIEAINNLNNEHSNKLNWKSFLKKLHHLIKNFFPRYHKVFEIFPGGKELVRKSGALIALRSSPLLPKILILRSFLQTTKSEVNNNTN